jgi:hypothetical protein
MTPLEITVAIIEIFLSVYGLISLIDDTKAYLKRRKQIKS